MAILYGIVKTTQDLNTSGTFDITDSGTFGGATPKAALVFGVTSAADATVSTPMRLSISATDGTSQWGISARFRDAVTASTSSPSIDGANNTMVSFMSPSTNSANYIAALDSLIANGLRLNATTTTTLYDGDLITSLFGGSDLSAKVGTITASSGISGTASVSGFGFQPDFIFLFSMSTSTTGFDSFSAASSINSYALTAGIKTASAQKSVTWQSVGATTTDNQARISSDRIAHEPSSGKYHTCAIDSDGFTITTQGATGEKNFGYLALKLTNASIHVGTDTTPTSTGTKTHSTSFTPLAFGMFQSLIDTVDSNKTDGQAGRVNRN